MNSVYKKLYEQVSNLYTIEAERCLSLIAENHKLDERIGDLEEKVHRLELENEELSERWLRASKRTTEIDGLISSLEDVILRLESDLHGAI